MANKHSPMLLEWLKVNDTLPRAEEVILKLKLFFENEVLNEEDKSLVHWFIINIIPMVHATSWAKSNWQPTVHAQIWCSTSLFQLHNFLR